MRAFLLAAAVLLLAPGLAAADPVTDFTLQTTGTALGYATQAAALTKAFSSSVLGVYMAPLDPALGGANSIVGGAVGIGNAVGTVNPTVGGATRIASGVVDVTASSADAAAGQAAHIATGTATGLVAPTQRAAGMLVDGVEGSVPPLPRL